MQSLENKGKIRMTSQDRAASSVNVTGTDQKIDARLTHTDSPDVHGWQPIETVPRDGTEVWLGAADTDPRRQRVGVAFWSRQGWRFSDDDLQIVWTPTHWQPYFVPAPPVLP